jgi:vacuolar protein sorting-associated protein 54
MSTASTCESAGGSPAPTGLTSVVSNLGGYVPWKRCVVCRLQTSGDVDPGPFRSARDFARHLRDYHCTREGGSYVCHYGLNGVCPSLPVEGVSDRDYEDHVAKDHANVADVNSSSSSPIRSAGNFISKCASHLQNQSC